MNFTLTLKMDVIRCDDSRAIPSIVADFNVPYILSIRTVSVCMCQITHDIKSTIVVASVLLCFLNEDLLVRSGSDHFE